MTTGDQSTPPGSGEVDAPMRVVVCSRRIALAGPGDVIIANDLADLLIALDEHQRVTVVVDVPATPIELGFFARLARDFPSTVALIVQGVPAIDRRAFHDQGVYRAQFEPIEDGALPVDGHVVDRGELVAAVARKLERQPTPLISLPRP